jgi:hypothetical protein
MISSDMRARIADIPAEQEPTWGAVVAVLRFDNRVGWKMHWNAHHPQAGKPFSIIDIEVPGEDVEGLRAEIEEAVDLVNEIVERDPLKTMVRADVGLAEVLVS